MKHAEDELVWIDANGVAHPLGEVAAERMRARVGAYRMLPSPGHLVFLRFTGADGRRDLEDGAIVRLAGEITAPGSMCDVLAILGQVTWRGELVVMDSDTTRSVFFDRGNIVGAHTTADDERLGMILYRYGVLNESQLGAVLERARSGPRVGMAAIELGLVSREQVYKYLAKQIEEVVFSVLMLADGMFCFLDGFDDARLDSRQVISANALLMNHVTRIDEIRYFRPWIPAADYVPERVSARAPSPEYAAVWALIDGRRNVEDIGRTSGLGEFEVTKQLFQLAQSQQVAILPPKLRGGTSEAVELASAALRTIHQAVDSAGRGTAFRNSIAGFARGAYDELLRGAGPFEHGGFNAPAIVRNAQKRGGGDVETYLREMLYDYVSFALFSATASLGPAAAALGAEVAPLLAKLRPQGQSGLYTIPTYG